MAKQKPASDINMGAAALVREATGTKRPKGEDLISDPKLRKAFLGLKKKAKKTKV